MISGKAVMLITGTSSGIGNYLAGYYADKGYQVIGCSRKSAEIGSTNYEHHLLDVTDEHQVKHLFKNIRKRHGKLDILLNNAGIASMNHALLTPLHTVKEILETNVLGTFLFCREAAKLMKINKYGRIVNFATVATELKLEGEAVYAGSKAAVVTLTEIMAREFAAMNITVNAIGPAPIRTNLIRNVQDAKLNKVIARQAIKRYGEFRDVSNVVDFFIRQDSDFITGQTIYLGGV